MKKISELVDLRNLLVDTDIDSVTNTFCDFMKTIKSHADAVETATDISKPNLDDSFFKLEQLSKNTSKKFNAYIEEINACIRINDDELRRNSIRLDQASNSDPANSILEKVKARESTHHQDTLNLFKERCKLYSDWKYPGMQIRPGYGTWTRELVDLDPLYLVDTHEELLHEIKKQFNDNYLSRLRFATISDIDKPIFGKLPQNQFGLIVVTEFFNQKNISTIKRYLKEIFSLLRSGGVCVFTFNDCDFSEAVRNSENNYDCYTPGNEIIGIVKELGFEIIDRFNSGGTLSWMEIQHPGEISSLRGGQTLAKIQITQ